MDIKEAYLILEKYLSKSKGLPISIGKRSFTFDYKMKCNIEDIDKFEYQYGIKLPEEYKKFILNFGSVDIFIESGLSGYEILHPSEISKFSHDVFF